MNWKKIIKTICVGAILQVLMLSQAYAQTYSFNNGRSVYLSPADRFIQQQLPSTLNCGDYISITGNRSSFYALYGPNASYKKSGQEVYSVSDVNVNSRYITTSGIDVSVSNLKMTNNMSGLFIFYNLTNGYYKGASRKYITINHNWGGWTQTTAATCTAAGSKKRTCSGCGATETATINALGHSWTGWESDGNNHWKRCTRCNTKTSQGTHNWGSYYGDTATCTAGGTKKHKCGTCGREVTVSSSALGHVWPSTYTQDGGYLYKYCTRCKAQLEKKPISYSIKFNGNGATSGSMIGQGFAYGTAQNLFENAFVRQNYEFIGWANDENATIPIYKDQQSVNNLTTTNNATINLYAVWKLSTTTITFHDQSGAGGPGEVVWLIGSTQLPTAPKREGYNFSGWNTVEDGSGAAWPKDNIVPANITDYYAQWIPNMYTTVQERNQKQ